MAALSASTQATATAALTTVRDMSARSADAIAGYDSAISGIGDDPPAAATIATAVHALTIVRDQLCISADAKAGAQSALDELNA